MASTTVSVPRGPANIRAGIQLFEFSWFLVFCYACVRQFASSGRFEWQPPAILAGYAAVMLLLHRTWLKGISVGRRLATIAAFLAYVPSLWLTLLAPVFALGEAVASMLDSLGGIGRAALGVAILLLPVFLLVNNILSPGLGHWLRLNGRCPSCREGRLLKGKPGTAEVCPVCGAELRFSWVE